MELLRQELRKIWNPWTLLILTVLGALYYLLFPGYYTKDFGYGDSVLRLPVYTEWAKKYGPTLEPAERAELDGQLEREKALFAEQLALFPFAAEQGIKDWDSFRAFNEARVYGKGDMQMERVFWTIVENTNYFRVDAVGEAIDCYDGLAENRPPDLNYDGRDPPALTARKLARIEEIKASDMVHGYLPTVVFSCAGYISRYFTVWSLLSVVLLLSPTLVRDRLRRTRLLQWSSRTGRRVLKTQFLAAELSALGLWIINLAAYGIPFLAQHPLIYRDFRLFEFLTFSIPWFDWTFGVYLLILAGMVLALSLAAAGFTVFLSQYSGHYIAMLLKAVPLFAVLAWLCSKMIINRAFLFGNPLSELTGLPGPEFFSILLLAALSIALPAVAYRQQLRRELCASAA
ncbi:MAG: hypothetical protein IJ705_04490 [Oscillospiraceae bacterium]|nr:hypothetical protein [Oscillospiraceae bacterium]